MIDQKFKSDVVFGYVAQAGAVCAGFLFMFLATQYGGLHIYGALVLLLSASGMLNNLLSFRTNEALVAFYKQGQAVGDAARCRFAVVAGISIDLCVALILFATIQYGRDLIALHLLKDATTSEEVGIYSYVVLAATLRSTPVAFLQATERLKFANAISLSEQLIRVSLVSIFILVDGELTLRRAVFAVLVPAGLALGVAYAPLCKALLKEFTSAISLKTGLVREYAAFTMNTFASSALKAGNQNIDTVILGLVTDTRIAGLYAVFRQFLSPVDYLSTPFSATAYPRFVQAAVLKRYGEIGEAIRGINDRLILASLGVVTVSSAALILYSSATNLTLDQRDHLAFGILAAAVVIRNQLWWGRAFANAVQPTISLKANLLSTALSLSLLYPLCLFLSISGAALGVLLGQVAVATFYRGALRQYDSGCVKPLLQRVTRAFRYEKRIRNSK